MKRAKLIVGFGNPGPEYSDTRHNIGFQCIDHLARSLGVKLNIEKKKSIYGKKLIGESMFLLLKPQTFITHSGEAVLYLASFMKININDIFVIFDDILSPFTHVSMIRESHQVRHSAIRSLNESLISDEFEKCSVGIGPLPNNVTEEDFYLSPFLESERRHLPEVFGKVTENVLEFLSIPNLKPQKVKVR